MTKLKPRPKGKERRETERKEVLETFHVFIVVPKLGLRKLHLKDVSAGGLGLVAEAGDRFKAGDEFEFFFYLNPGLRLPLKAKIAHVAVKDGAEQRVGCELIERSSKAYKAYVEFLTVLDSLSAFVL